MALFFYALVLVFLLFCLTLSLELWLSFAASVFLQQRPGLGRLGAELLMAPMGSCRCLGRGAGRPVRAGTALTVASGLAALGLLLLWQQQSNLSDWSAEEAARG